MAVCRGAEEAARPRKRSGSVGRPALGIGRGYAGRPNGPCPCRARPPWPGTLAAWIVQQRPYAGEKVGVAPVRSLEALEFLEKPDGVFSGEAGVWF
jgi:hypothetical protein